MKEIEGDVVNVVQEAIVFVDRVLAGDFVLPLGQEALWLLVLLLSECEAVGLVAEVPEGGAHNDDFEKTDVG